VFFLTSEGKSNLFHNCSNIYFVLQVFCIASSVRSVCISHTYIEPNVSSHIGSNQFFAIRSIDCLYHYRSPYWAMRSLSVQYIAFMLSLSTASDQHWNRTTTASVIFHVRTHFRSTCVFLYYNQETKDMGKKCVLSCVTDRVSVSCFSYGCEFRARRLMVFIELGVNKMFIYMLSSCFLPFSFFIFPIV
jgi:hypothetical protein